MSVQYLYIESIGQTKYYEKDFHAKRVKPVRFDYEKTSRVYSGLWKLFQNQNDNFLQDAFVGVFI